MGAEPLVTVVMSVFNGERFLAEAMESILEQTFRDFEFVIIDDGSIDGSRQILDSYAERDSRVRVFHQQRRGLIDALNEAFGIARGKYVARMDADDVSVPDRLLWQLDFMEKRPEVGALGGGIELIDEQGRAFGSTLFPPDDFSIRSALYQAECFLCHPTVVTRKSVWRSTAGYRRVFLHAEDYDLWLQIAKLSQLANLDRAVLRYRIHSGQISQRRLVQQSLSTLAAWCVALGGGGRSFEPNQRSDAVDSATLERLGVSQALQQQYLAARYRNCICMLRRKGELSDALSVAMGMLNSSRWEHVERWLMAQIWLIVASVYWRQRKLLRSLSALGRALMTRPLVAGRPLKLLLLRFRNAWTAKDGPNPVGMASSFRNLGLR